MILRVALALTLVLLAIVVVVAIGAHMPARRPRILLDCGFHDRAIDQQIDLLGDCI